MLQGYLAHKKQPPRRTYAQGPMVILDGCVFLMIEAPLYAGGGRVPSSDRTAQGTAKSKPLTSIEQVTAPTR